MDKSVVLLYILLGARREPQCLYQQYPRFFYTVLNEGISSFLLSSSPKNHSQSFSK